MGLRRKIGGAAKGLAVRLGIAYAVQWVRDAAEGRQGPVWKARYDWWAGKKTWSGVALMVAAVAGEALGYHDIAWGVYTAGGLLSSVGLVDRAYRSEIPAAIADNPVYRFLASHGELVGGALVTIAALAIDADCGRWCDVTQDVVLVLGAIAVQLRITDPAWKARPPLVDIAVLSRYLEEEDDPRR